MIRLSYYVDFYLLEAMLATASTSLPPGKATDKFISDVQYQQDCLVETFAKGLYDYLLAASLGEARHAGRFSLKRQVVYDGETKRGRSWVYEHMDGLNDEWIIAALRNVFADDNGWGGGFGGRAWLEIVKTAEMYRSGTINAHTFIDRCADLEHNGGCVFNKPVKWFDFDMRHRILHELLNIKRDAPNLALYSQADDANWPTVAEHATSRVAFLWKRYATLAGEYDNDPELKETIRFAIENCYSNPGNKDDPYPHAGYRYGDNTFPIIELPACKKCGTTVSNHGDEKCDPCKKHSRCVQCNESFYLMNTYLVRDAYVKMCEVCARKLKIIHRVCGMRTNYLHFKNFGECQYCEETLDKCDNCNVYTDHTIGVHKGYGLDYWCEVCASAISNSPGKCQVCDVDTVHASVAWVSVHTQGEWHKHNDGGTLVPVCMQCATKYATTCDCGQPVTLIEHANVHAFEIAKHDLDKHWCPACDGDAKPVDTTTIPFETLELLEA